MSSTSMSLSSSTAVSFLPLPSCGASGCVLLRRAYRVAGAACVPVVPAAVLVLVEEAAEDAWFRSWML